MADDVKKINFYVPGEVRNSIWQYEAMFSYLKLIPFEQALYDISARSPAHKRNGPKLPKSPSWWSWGSGFH